MAIVFHPKVPLRDLSHLVCGIVMILTAIVVSLKVKSKSKNTFSYLLMSFTFAMGVSNVGIAFSEAFRQEIIINDLAYYLQC